MKDRDFFGHLMCALLLASLIVSAAMLGGW